MLARCIRTDGFIDPCIPSRAPKPPSGPGWVHEIKHDGYRLIVRREGDAVRLFTRRGFDWTERYPAIAAAAACRQSFTLDGEAVAAGTRRRPASCFRRGQRRGLGPASHSDGRSPQPARGDEALFTM
jgi:ATP-dependent DNA ligase